QQPREPPQRRVGEGVPGEGPGDHEEAPMSRRLGIRARGMRRVVLCALATSVAVAARTSAAPPGPNITATPEERHEAEEVSLHHALLSLPVAAVRAAALALRPQRRSPPPRQPPPCPTNPPHTHCA